MNATQRAALHEPHILVYGHGDKSARGFPTHDDLIRYIKDDVVTANQCRYRYTQSKRADIIVLSQDGLAFGHFYILRRETPNDVDRADYPRVKCVYIIGSRSVYKTPVVLRPILGRPVNQFGVPITATQFEQIKSNAKGIQEFESEELPNIFRHYNNLENHFTNQLISLLSLSRFVPPQLLTPLLKTLGIDPNQKVLKFRVLRGIDGTADAELSGNDFCVLIETKIERGKLDDAQICRHLERLNARSEAQRSLVLLTPDDGSSSYIRQFRAKYRRVTHLEWKAVYELCKGCTAGDRVVSELARQFLAYIHDRIIEQDIVGIIQKIAFGPNSGLSHNTFLDEFNSDNGIGLRWNTPREYKALDGKGRKLLLYDGTQPAITAEVEIREVRCTNDKALFPWTNFYSKETKRVFEPPIPLTRIQTIPTFEKFGTERASHRNITYQQYMMLTHPV